VIEITAMRARRGLSDAKPLSSRLAGQVGKDDAIKTAKVLIRNSSEQSADDISHIRRWSVAAVWLVDPNVDVLTQIVALVSELH
jgi:hypothetical protein